jgi:hypothetical protein
LEVLISTFIMAIGLLSLAALIPVGRFAVMEAGKADRGGACARAALREVKVRNMFDGDRWFLGAIGGVGAAGQPFVIDPVIVNAQTYPGTADQYLGTVPRIGLRAVTYPGGTETWTAMSQSEADAGFRWRDDLVFNMPGDEAMRPSYTNLGAQGYYSWFLTAVPTPGNLNVFDVSVAVCYRRSPQPATISGTVHLLDEDIRTVRPAWVYGGWGGPGVQVTGPWICPSCRQAVTPIQDVGTACPHGGCGKTLPGVKVKEHDWVLLYDGVDGDGNGVITAGEFIQCKWYRVVSVAGSPASYLQLTGPDWNNVAGRLTTLVIVPEVITVATTTMRREGASIWNQ